VVKPLNPASPGARNVKFCFTDRFRTGAG